MDASDQCAKEYLVKYLKGHKRWFIKILERRDILTDKLAIKHYTFQLPI
jgi:hypothetical protein